MLPGSPSGSSATGRALSSHSQLMSANGVGGVGRTGPSFAFSESAQRREGYAKLAAEHWKDACLDF